MQYRARSRRISHAKSAKTTRKRPTPPPPIPRTSRLATVYERYEARLRQANALDFDDLLLEAVRLLAPRRRPRATPPTAATNSS